MAAASKPAASEGGGRKASVALTTALVLPAGLWYLVLLVAPLASWWCSASASAPRTAATKPAFTLDNYTRFLTQPQRFSRS